MEREREREKGTGVKQHGEGGERRWRWQRIKQNSKTETDERFFLTSPVGDTSKNLCVLPYLTSLSEEVSLADDSEEEEGPVLTGAGSGGTAGGL